MAWSPNEKTLLVIAGPTASGKTTLAIQTAKQYNTEILSADSRQFYQEMTIGTAKPTKHELMAVKHHFINSLSIHDEYSAGDYEKDALAKLNELFNKKNIVVLAGGSGLYIKALCDGFDQLPKVPIAMRQQLTARLENEGLALLSQELLQKDPNYAKTVDLNNPQRVLRALEVIEYTGKPFSYFRLQNRQKRQFTIRYFGLDWDRNALYERINQRVDQMMSDGLEDEAKQLHPYKSLNALQTVGYTEFFDYFEGKIDKQEAIRLIKRNSRRYAKRQMTWFRKIENFNWIKQPYKINI